MVEERMSANQAKTDVQLKELTERIEKSQAKLQTVEVSLDAQARKFREDSATIRSDHLKDYDLTNTTVHATIEETRSAIEAAKCEFQARLELVEVKTEGGKRTRSVRNHGTATCIRKEYILVHVPMPVRDRS
jgi:hypothetical protein